MTSARRVVTAALAALVTAGCLALAPDAPALATNSRGATAVLSVRPGALCPATRPGYRCMAQVAFASSGPSIGLSPRQLQAAYGLTGATAPGTTVAVVDAYRAPDVARQLDAYCSAFNLGCSSAQLRVMNQHGSEIWPQAAGSAPPRQPADAFDRSGSGWAQETAMDVQMVAAVCPSCNILLVSADSDDRGGSRAHGLDLETAVRIAARNANYVSMSWGTDETRAIDAYDKTVLGQPNVIYTAAAGDWAGDLPIWPAVSPRAVAVGGTRLTSTGGSWSESVWSEGGSSCALYERQPAWQRAFGAIGTACAKRAAADVAVVGDPATGVAVCLAVSFGTCVQWARVGGTSVGAPLVAAMYALAGNHTQRYAPYAHAADMRDVTRGSNALPRTACGLICTARAGWDGPTGVGSPRNLNAFRPGVVLRNPGPVTAWKGGAVNWDLSRSGVGWGAAAGYVQAPGSTLPAGTSFNATTGHVTGRPTAIGSGYLTVTTGDGHSSMRLRWTVRNRVTITEIRKRTHTVGKRIGGFSVHARDTTRGLALAFRAAHLPPGIHLNKATGRFTGKAKKAGTYHVVVTVRDTTGGTGSAKFTWRVNHRFVRTSATAISGGRWVGSTLSVITPTLRRDTKSGPVIHPTFRYRWYVDGKPIRRATHQWFTVPQRLRGHRISVRYRALRAGYTTYRKMISARIN
jgi:hypothetical protein